MVLLEGIEREDDIVTVLLPEFANPGFWANLLHNQSGLRLKWALLSKPGLVVTKRLRMEGFIVMDFYDRRAEAEQRLARWVAEGKIKAVVDVVDGLDKAPEALIGLFAGKNRGKMAVRV